MLTNCPKEKKQKDKTKIFHNICGTVVNLTTDWSFDIELCGKILMALHMWIFYFFFKCHFEVYTQKYSVKLSGICFSLSGEEECMEI